MCEVPVLYATTEGQTRRIAERLAHHLRERGLDSIAMAIDSNVEVFEDKEVKGEWRVEYFDDDGGC